VGRGTVCYLARKDGEEFIIKDYWAMGGDEEALNEIHMMEKMSGVRGVPKLVEYWLVESEPNKVDQTQNYRFKSVRSLKGTFRTHVRVVLKPRARPLHKFRTKLELLTSIRDIVQIQKEAVEQRKVLHRDCSLNNSMIEDDGNGSQGMLIDWEFAVKIAKNETYTVGGTGASSSKPYPAPLIKHSYQDDLESVFYVFIWILIEF
ncbi:hypothetical protein DEU56DRAFT_700850, partial [Suillus clintonianus]|uniref:uncharacterized protein n=1 Tax=Suillus clintonianus TaxID=1904413 RepID=UPI001B873FFE